MQLPDYPHVIFENPPLALVVGQIRFAPLPGFAEGVSVAAFGRRLRDRYPKRERVEQINISLSPAHGVEQQQGPMLWKFSSTDDAWSVVLAEDALTLEVRGYTFITEFLDRFSEIIDCLVETLDPGLQTRLGLRYIDEFRYPGAATIADWATLIRPEVLGLATTADELFGSSTVQNTRQQLEISLPDGALTIRHGLLSGTSIQPLAGEIPPQGPFYLLDMDYYSVGNQEIRSGAVVDTMTAYNQTMYRFFRWVMRDKLYESLEPRDDS